MALRIVEYLQIVPQNRGGSFRKCSFVCFILDWSEARYLVLLLRLLFLVVNLLIIEGWDLFLTLDHRKLGSQYPQDFRRVHKFFSEGVGLRRYILYHTLSHHRLFSGLICEVRYVFLLGVLVLKRLYWVLRQSIGIGIVPFYAQQFAQFFLISRLGQKSVKIFADGVYIQELGRVDMVWGGVDGRAIIQVILLAELFKFIWLVGLAAWYRFIVIERVLVVLVAKFVCPGRVLQLFSVFIFVGHSGFIHLFTRIVQQSLIEGSSQWLCLRFSERYLVGWQKSPGCTNPIRLLQIILRRFVRSSSGIFVDI